MGGCAEAVFKREEVGGIEDCRGEEAGEGGGW